MACPLRLEFAGALYHVTALGNAREKMFVADQDRHGFLDLLGKEIEQQGWLCYAYLTPSPLKKLRLSAATELNRRLRTRLWYDVLSYLEVRHE